MAAPEGPERRMAAGVVAEAAAWDTSWARPVGTEVVVDWAGMVVETADKVEEETATGTTAEVAAEKALSVEAMVAGSMVVAASLAAAKVAMAAAEEAAGMMAVDAARRTHRASYSRCRRRHSDPQCNRPARMPRGGHK